GHPSLRRRGGALSRGREGAGRVVSPRRGPVEARTGLPEGGGQGVPTGDRGVPELGARCRGEETAGSARAGLAYVGRAKHGEAAVRKRDLEKFRKILLMQREQLAGNARRALSGDIHLDPDDFPDEMDAASSEINLAFTGRLRERERRLLAKIDQALEKIE